MTEYEFNKRFVSELGSQFAEKGSPKVEMLSENNLDLDLKQRTGRIKQFKYGILLSIHHDSVQPRYLSEWEHNKKQRKYSDLFFGFSLFVSAKSIAFSESVDSAQKLGEEFVKAGFLPSLHHNEPIPGENRPLLDGKIGLYRFDELAVLRHSKIPAVLVEVGIIVNREEENKLNNLVYRMQFQKALAGAVSRFCEQGRLD